MFFLYRNKMRKILGISLLIFYSFFFIQFSFSFSLQDWISSPKKVKNVILIIGDGFSIPSTSLIKDYYKFFKKDEKNYFIEFIKKSNISITSVNSADFVITDSAASATAIATGYKTKNNYLGLDSEGNPVRSLIDIFNKEKKYTGIVVNTRITHATPAAFYARLDNRNLEQEIGEQAFLRNDIKLILGGGLEYFVPVGLNVDEFKRKYNIKYPISPIRTDEKNIIDLWADQKNDTGEKSVKLVFSRDDLIKANVEKGQVIRGIFADSFLPYELDRKNSDIHSKNVPTLTDMYNKAVSILEQNPHGFFLVLESGLIDQAEHAVDIGSVLHEMIELNNLLGAVMEYVEKNPDTIVILTGDHDAGGFGIVYTFQHSNNNLVTKFYHNQNTFVNIFKKQGISFEELFKVVTKEKTKEGVYINVPELTKLLNNNFSIEVSVDQVREIFKIDRNGFFNYKKAMIHYPNIKYFHPEKRYLNGILADYLSTRLGIVWNSGTHTSNMINTYSYGSKEIEKSFIENSDIFTHIFKSTRD